MRSSNEIRDMRIECFLKFISDKRPVRVLDIGCQKGDICNNLKQLGHEVYGMEIVDDLISEARANYPEIEFRKGDCEKSLPFEEHFFDIVWAGDVIEHIRFTDVFVNEINRVLKKGGRFILTTPMHNKLKNTLISLVGFEKHFDPEFPHLRFYSPKSLDAVLSKRGFRIDLVKYLGRIRPLAKSMFIVATKLDNKTVINRHRY